MPGTSTDPEKPFVYDPLAPDPEATYDPLASEPAPPATSDPESESTIGTGTSIALGCIAGSVVLIIIAILILFLYSAIVN
ncbi:MAG: hypothetical protein QM589_15885 [Thermomicrobiales bacterium]